MKNSKLRVLVECGVLIALGCVLSLVTIFQMPFGGSVTLLSMLPIIYIGFAHGPSWGFGASFVFSVFQLMSSQVTAWGLTPTVLVVCVLADYIFAFTLLGVTGFFRKSGQVGIIAGTLLAMLLRLACHYISGVTIWAEMAPEGMSPWLYSIAYNGLFMLPELAFTLIGVLAIFKVPYFKRKLSSGE